MPKATEPAPSTYVTLVSNDGFEYHILRSAATLSGTIRRSLDPQYGFAESKMGRVTFEDINGVILEKVCEYLYYKQKFAEAKDVPDLDIPAEICLELFMAADYLDV